MKLWKFLRDPKNLAVLGAIGAVLAFLWKDVIQGLKKEDPPSSVSQTAAAGPGGTAANAANNSQIHFGGMAPSPSAGAIPAAKVDQKAEAQGGVAVNATGNSQVSVPSASKP